MLTAVVKNNITEVLNKETVHYTVYVHCISCTSLMVRNKKCILIYDGEGFIQKQIISSTCIIEKRAFSPNILS